MNCNKLRQIRLQIVTPYQRLQTESIRISLFQFNSAYRDIMFDVCSVQYFVWNEMPQKFIFLRFIIRYPSSSHGIGKTIKIRVWSQLSIKRQIVIVLFFQCLGCRYCRSSWITQRVFCILVFHYLSLWLCAWTISIFYCSVYSAELSIEYHCNVM